MGDTRYIYAVARIRVLEKKLLTDDDVRQMIGMKDEASVIAFLEDKGWGDTTTHEDPEAMLALETKRTMDLMRELKVDPEVFRILTLPKYYHNLKAAVKDSLTEGSFPASFYPLEDMSREEAMRIIGKQDFAALPEEARVPVKRAYDVLSTTRDGQLSDVIIDRACMEAMLRAAKNTKNAMLRDYEKSQVSVMNMKIAYRAARTDKSLAFLKEALAPCDELDVEALARAAAKGTDSMLTWLDEHGFQQAAEAMRTSASAFEQWCDNRLIETIRPQKTNSISVGPVIAYEIGRENEIRNVRIILTAKANGFTPEQTEGKVREMYG